MIVNYNNKKNFFKKILLLFFSAMISLVVLEITLHINSSLKQNEVLTFLTEEENDFINKSNTGENQYQPYVLWRHQANINSDAVKTNSVGLRNKEIIKIKDSDTYRIIILGGSAAWGYGASSNEQIISSLLEKELKENYDKKIQVINFAENGYNSSQELILWGEISEYDPDLVIHYTGYNDIYTGFEGLPPGWNHRFIKEDILTKNSWNLIKGLLKVELGKLLKEFKIYQAIKYRLIKYDIFKVQKEIIFNNNFSNLEDISSIFVKNISYSQQIANLNKSDLLVIIQPNIFTDEKVLSKREKVIASNFNIDYPEGKKYFIDGYQLIMQQLNDNNIDYVNGNTFFQDIDNDIYFDTVHYFDKGNQIIAKEISKIIFDRNLLK